MSDFYSFYDESYNDVNGHDFFDLVAEDRYEEYFAEDDYEQQYEDDAVADYFTQRGTSRCAFATSSRHNFDNFYDYLRSQGFNIMKSSEAPLYKVDIFELTKEDADWLTKVFCANRHLVSKKSCGLVA